MDENERIVIDLLTPDSWNRIVEVAASDPKNREFVEVSNNAHHPLWYHPQM